MICGIEKYLCTEEYKGDFGSVNEEEGHQIQKKMRAFLVKGEMSVKQPVLPNYIKTNGGSSFLLFFCFWVKNGGKESWAALVPL